MSENGDENDVGDSPKVELEGFKNNRTNIKRELTRFQTFLDKYESSKFEQLQVRLKDAKTLLDRFRNVQTDIEELTLSKIPENYDEQQYEYERETFENKYFDVISEAEKIINLHCQATSPVNPCLSTSSSSGLFGAGAGAGAAGGSGMQLPPSFSPFSAAAIGQPAALPNVASQLGFLKVPKFTGDYAEWQRFSDIFRAIVHSANIPDVAKFCYLEEALVGEPKKLIASLTATDGNYKIAWDLLKNRYDNRKIIINSHLKEIMEIPSVNRDSHIQLRSLSNTFFKAYRSLDAMGENVKDWDRILIYILVSKLDFNSKKEWEIYCKNLQNPTTEDFNKFLSQRCQILETLDSKSYSSNTNMNKKHESKSFLTNSENTFKPKCPYCKEQHFIYFCEKFKQLSIPDRTEQVKKLSLCSNCLRFGHRNIECKSTGCKICGQRHATLLHKDNRAQNNFQKSHNNSRNSDRQDRNSKSHLVTETDNRGENSDDSSRSHEDIENSETTFSNSCQDVKDSFNLLSTAIVDVYDKDRKLIPCRVLLDSGSQSNFISKSFLKKLKLNTEKIDISVIGISQTKTTITEKTEIELFSRHTNFKRKLKFFVAPSVSGFIPQRCFNPSKLHIPSELPLADPGFNIPSEINMLMGCEVFFELITMGQFKLGKGFPILQKTLLGWIISGPLPCGKAKGKLGITLTSSYHTQIQNTLQQSLERFWSVEEIENPLPRASLSQEELECEEHFIKNTTRDQAGRFVVKLPLKENFINLGESEKTALNRLYSLERRLSKNPKLEKQYKDFMFEYQDLGHMSEIPRDLASETPIVYIPHHSVEKPDSLTTKLRVVFDAACKTSTNFSLNDVLKVGPTIQNDLFSILVRFRKHSVVLVGDLAKMYRQILVHENERNLQRIIWRNSPEEEVKHFQLNTVTYGTASASFISTRCLQQVAIDNDKTYSIESDIIRSDFYVDDLLTGSTSYESLDKIRKNLGQILSEYGFELRKLQSNDPTLISNISQNDHECQSYVISDDSSVKTLGVSWVPHLDKFEYNSPSVYKEIQNITKRSILSFVAKIFDPLGILGPLSIRAKLIIQKLWKLHIDWDDTNIPEELISDWLKLKFEVSQVGLMQVPRHVVVKHPKFIEIHGFSDASECAYAGCIFIRSIDYDKHIESHLLCAKSRVSPLKCQSLPRLELLGALLLVRLLVKCIEALKISFSRTYFWTDSTIVLNWIAKEPKTWKTFIANRVAEIQQYTQIQDWNYIASEQNPADIISRGASLKKIIHSELWLHGPKFLTNSEQWPENSNIHFHVNSMIDIPEIKPISLLAQNNQKCSIFELFSDLKTLIHVIAYCLRFYHNSKLPKEGRRREKHLSISEIEMSEIALIKLVQGESFPKDLNSLQRAQQISQKSKLKMLSPFLDKNGIIRLGGRLKNSGLNYDIKHPIVLPTNHKFTQLIITYEHKRTLHSGTQCTLSHVRQKYWPLNGKSAVRYHIRKCVECFRANPHPNIYPKMGDLPQQRVNPSRPFLSISVDYAGPYELRASKIRTNKLVKGYICVFVCCSTKAVHFELITDLTSDGFLNLLKRFVSRRGICKDIFSDNGTNFVGANNIIISVQDLVEKSNFQGYLNHSKIKWHFLPARSPHFGGLHEAAVKSCKHHIKRVLKGVHLTYEEFYSLICQIEAILNSRPLIPISTDPHDLDVITPGHFIIGEQLTAIPEQDLTDQRINHVKRYRHIQQIKQHFWARWSKEYLHLLQVRNKWQFDTTPEFHLNSVVLIKEENVPPMCWPLGRIIEIHPGSDNITRVVSVKTRNGVVKRAINKLSLLPITD